MKAKFKVWIFISYLVFPSIACQQVGTILKNTPNTGPVVNLLFTIDIPQGWQAFFEETPEMLPPLDLGADLFGVIVNNDQVLNTEHGSYYTYSVSVLRKKIPQESSLTEVYQQTYQRIVLAYPESVEETSIMLGGMKGIERIYSHYRGEFRYDVRDVWIEKDGYAFILSCRCLYSSECDLYSEDFEYILHSFGFR